jgi:nicotinamidase-related amidase
MLTSDNAFLLIVDVQGKLAQLMANREILFANLQRMVKGALALELPIVWAEQLPDKLGPTIPEVCELLPGRKAIAKSTFSCCGNPALMDAIEATGRRQVLLVGIETHVCVYMTAIQLLERGFEVEVVADAVGSRIAANREIGLQKMVAAGASVSCTETVLFELMQTAEHPEFRTIQRAIM